MHVRAASGRCQVDQSFSDKTEALQFRFQAKFFVVVLVFLALILYLAETTRSRVRSRREDEGRRRKGV